MWMYGDGFGSDCDVDLIVEGWVDVGGVLYVDEFF